MTLLRAYFENMRLASCWISSSQTMWTLSMSLMNSCVLLSHICMNDRTGNSTEFILTAWEKDHTVKSGQAATDLKGDETTNRFKHWPRGNTHQTDRSCFNDCCIFPLAWSFKLTCIQPPKHQSDKPIQRSMKFRDLSITSQQQQQQKSRTAAVCISENTQYTSP